MLDDNYFDLALLILSSLIIGLIATPISILIAKKFEIIDYPKAGTHHIHAKPVPRAGGIAIFFSFLFIGIAYKLWRYPDFLSIMIPALLILSFGIWDDKKGMNAPVKLIGQILATTILINFDIRVKFLENQSFFIQLNQFFAIGIDVFITYVWMIGITNAMNMVDSIDGLVIGLCQTISAFFIIVSLSSGQEFLVILSAIIFGCSWGIKFFNHQPAIAFLGDSGAQTLGFLLATIAIAYYPKAFNQGSSWFTPILFFAVPIFDTTLVTISRLLKKQPFYKANLDHTYHRLVVFGWDQNRAVTIMQIAGIIFGLIAVCIIYLPPVPANAIFILWLIAFSLLIYFFEHWFRKKSK